MKRKQVTEKNRLANGLLDSLENLNAHRAVFSGEDEFEKFCNIFGFRLARHHREMAKRFERAILEPRYNCIICMPPGHAKSTYSSFLFPAYYIGRFPEKEILMTTHTAKFSARWGRRVRALVNTLKYKQVMGQTLTKDSRAADRFHLTNGSEYFSCGVSSSVSGYRSDLSIADDLFGSFADADSVVNRDKVWDWFTGDFCPRSKPDGSRLLISTRWNEDDVVGRIKNSHWIKEWDIIEFPAVAEEDDPLGRKTGEVLWPEHIPIETLEVYRTFSNKKDVRRWNCTYQQKPIVEQGLFFQKDWIKTSSVCPDFSDLVFYGASDYAVTSDGGDYTVHLVAAHHPRTDKIYIVDMWRGREDTDIWIEKFIDLCLKYKPRTWAEETGQIIKSLNPYIERAMIKRNCYVIREQFTSTSDKMSRARSIQGLMKSGDVIIMEEEWKEDFINELLKFEAGGKYDDIVDAFGLMGRLLHKMIFTPREKDKMKTDDYKSGKVLLPSLDHKLSTLNTYTDMI